MRVMKGNNKMSSISTMTSIFLRRASLIPCCAVLALTALTAEKAQAATIVLDFEGLQNLESVNGFYNGGSGGNGSTSGQNFGISFSSNSLALIDSDAGGSGNFGGEPSPDTGLFFLSGTAIMNVAAGFDTGFSFFYSSPDFPGTVNVYDELDGTGNLLASLNLPVTPSNGAPDPNGRFSPFLPFGVTFNGIARSVDFGGAANRIVFDDITLGAATPGGGDDGEPTSVPEPGSVMALLAIGGVSALKIKRQPASRAV